jgi:hypothetical protein
VARVVCGDSASARGTGDGCADCGLYILSHAASVASIMASVPQFLCFGGGVGDEGERDPPPGEMSTMAVAASLGIENVAVFILCEKAAADLTHSSGGTHDAQE